MNSVTLVVVASLVACGALILAVLERLWPTRPRRRRVRRRAPAPPPAPAAAAPISPSVPTVPVSPSLPVPPSAAGEPRGTALDADIGQLTAAAVREVAEHGATPDALTTLERAATLLRDTGDALPPERREEARRRLALAYTRLGSRHVEAGDFEDALDPLLRALAYAGEDARRRAEPAAVLAVAVREVAARRAARLGELAAGDGAEAATRARALMALVERAVAAGVPEESLTEVRRSVRALGGDVPGAG